jgi:Xaa-Pro dipeptidase
MKLLRAGVTFRDYSQWAWKIPERFVANRYFVSAHGCE